MANKKGLFITLEGPDGSGKTTMLHMVHEQLAKDFPNLQVVTTREPGGSPLAEAIRNVLLNQLDAKINYRAEALLFAASRSQHIADCIEPALDSGKIVLCDRYIDSSIVYQGYGRGLGYDAIMGINQFAMHGIVPNKTFFLMVKPEVGMERIAANSAREVNRMDLEKMEMHQKVYDAYINIMKYDRSGRIIEIDASKTLDEVFADTYAKVKALVENAK